jgi:hypothetical protein
MTNEAIIFNARCELMEAGKIGTTGRKIELETEDGEKVTMMEPEEIHTFAGWRDRGYIVKKGQHATAKIVIWKHTVKKAKKEGEEDTEKMFQKLAAFFTPAQVEAIEGGQTK